MAGTARRLPRSDHISSRRDVFNPAFGAQISLDRLGGGLHEIPAAGDSNRGASFSEDLTRVKFFTERDRNLPGGQMTVALLDDDRAVQEHLAIVAADFETGCLNAEGKSAIALSRCHLEVHCVFDRHDRRSST